MAGLLYRFMKDRRGTSFEGIALSVSIVAVAFVASADMLDYVVKKHRSEPAAAVVARPANVPGRDLPSRDLDETPTASVPAPLPALVTRSVLDPCTGRVKASAHAQ